MRKVSIKLLGILALLAFALGALAPSDASAMNKAELIDAIASDAGLSKADAKRALDGFADSTAVALKKGDRVALVGFGSFSVSKAVSNSNPRGSAHIPDAHSVKFSGGDMPERPNETVIYNEELASLMAKERCGDEAGERPEEADRKCEDRFLKVSLKFLDSFGPTVLRGLEEDGSVEIDGFGEFFIPGSDEAGRGRNPQTGKEIKIAAKNVVKFKAGADLSKKVN